MLQNVNENTGIRYGIISANSLHPDLVDTLMYGTNAKDVHFEEAKSELWADIKSTCKDYMSDDESDEVADLAVENMSQNWQQDEPVFEGEHDGVKYRTTWLGGALLVFFLESPYTLRGDLCSPCIPGAVNLDSPNPDGFEGYAPPSDWFAEESSDECSG